MVLMPACVRALRRCETPMIVTIHVLALCITIASPSLTVGYPAESTSVRRVVGGSCMHWVRLLSSVLEPVMQVMTSSLGAGYNDM